MIGVAAAVPLRTRLMNVQGKRQHVPDCDKAYSCLYNHQLEGKLDSQSVDDHTMLHKDVEDLAITICLAFLLKKEGFFWLHM